ncbi:MAG: arginine N-succinyltransferase [Pacificimonas sp.]|jgi:arginine N-succinyltransferase|nr:arginine N-succinyltransferase [Pacificimonas sp.]
MASETRFHIRLAGARDLPDLLRCSEEAGPGFTSLPRDPARLERIVDGSRHAADGGQGAILMILWDNEAETVAGCASVKRGGSPRASFANFRVVRDESGEAAHLGVTSAYAEHTEVGALFVRPPYRDKGVGGWLARSRYLLIASAPESFGSHVFAELRGDIKAGGGCDFYDAIVRPHVGHSFLEADRLWAAGREDEVLSRLPEGGIDLTAHSLAERRLVGQCHRDGTRALAMLLADNFRQEGVVDLLDGGPLVICETGRIGLLSRTHAMTVSSASARGAGQPAVIAAGGTSAFRCIRSVIAAHEDGIVVPAAAAERLGVRSGDTVQVQFPASARSEPGTALVGGRQCV